MTISGTCHDQLDRQVDIISSGMALALETRRDRQQKVISLMEDRRDFSCQMDILFPGKKSTWTLKQLHIDDYIL